MIKLANELNDGTIEYDVYDCFKEPKESHKEKYNVITSVWFLQHSKNQEELAQNIKNVAKYLKKEGGIWIGFEMNLPIAKLICDNFRLIKSVSINKVFYEDKVSSPEYKAGDFIEVYIDSLEGNKKTSVPFIVHDILSYFLMRDLKLSKEFS